MGSDDAQNLLFGRAATRQVAVTKVYGKNTSYIRWIYDGFPFITNRLNITLF